MFPDWSPDGNSIVFVRTATACTPSAPNFGQASIFVYGGSLVTMTTTTAAARQRDRCVLQAAAGENNYYPSFSPDGQYIAFTRAPSSTKSSWSLANTAVHRPGRQRPVATTTRRRPSGSCRRRAARRCSSSPPTARPCRPTRGPSGAPRPTATTCGSRSRRRARTATCSPASPRTTRSGSRPSRALGAPAAIRRRRRSGSPSRTPTTKNHIGVWSVKVGGYTIP